MLDPSEAVERVHRQYRRELPFLPAARRSMGYFDTGNVDSLAAGVRGRIPVSRSTMEQVVPEAIRGRVAYCKSAL